MSNRTQPAAIKGRRLSSLPLVLLVLGMTLPKQLDAQDIFVTAPAIEQLLPDLFQPRELYVPESDLQLLLNGETRHVFMTRQELAELRQRAGQTVKEPLPENVVLLSARYQATIEQSRSAAQGRAVVQGQLNIEALADGLQSLPLALSGCTIRTAKIDGQAAPLLSDNSRLLVLVEGKGVHSLELDMLVPVTTRPAQQMFEWQLPMGSNNSLSITVPGNVDLESGASVLKRSVDADRNQTHFDLLPTNQAMRLVMSLNNRKLRDQTSVRAQAVLIDEVTQGYERLHASLSMRVLHGAADAFRFVLPDGFEVTHVATPLLIRWSVEKVQVDDQWLKQLASAGLDGQAGQSLNILNVQLREPATDLAVIQVRADRTTTVLADWQMPKLVPLDVVSFASIIGLMLEERLSTQAFDTQNLIAIDHKALMATLPALGLSVQAPPSEAAIASPSVRPTTVGEQPSDRAVMRTVAAHYAASPRFRLSSRIDRKPPVLSVTSNQVLTIRDSGLEMDGGFVLIPRSEKLFSFDFSIPVGWNIETVRLSSGQALPFDIYAAGENQRVRVHVPQGMTPDQQTSVLFHAVNVPDNWLSNDATRSVALPHIAIIKSDDEPANSAIFVSAMDDFRAVPSDIQGLVAISENEKSKYGASSSATNFAWRTVDRAWQGSLQINRVAPRITARILTFAQIQPDLLTMHYECTFDVQQARTGQLAFSLPSSTPNEINVRGYGNVTVKETSYQMLDDRRVWRVDLAERQQGQVRLAVDYTQNLSPPQLEAQFAIPELRAEAVAYQSGIIAVEGHAEIDVNIVSHPRSVDMGELVDAEHQVGKRLLGVYGYVGNEGRVVVKGSRPAGHALPTTIVQRAELFTLVGVGGRCETAARYALRTKAEYLEIRLPATAQLWSAVIDGRPALPERQGNHVVIPLGNAPAEQLRNLQLVYEQPTPEFGLTGGLELEGPTLWQRAQSNDSDQQIPVADLAWQLALPDGYRLVQSGGTVTHLPGAEDDESLLEQLWQKTPNLWEMLPLSRRNYRTDGEASYMSDAAPPMASSAPAMDGKSLPAADNGMQAGLAELAKSPPPVAAPLPGVALQGGDVPAGQVANPPQPPGTQSAEAAAASKTQVANSIWALEGIRSLSIDLGQTQTGKSEFFQSLGEAPVVSVTVSHARRWQWLGCALGLSLFVWGIFYTRPSLLRRIVWIVAILLAAWLLPAGLGLERWLMPIVEPIVLACLALFLVTLFHTPISRLLRFIRSRWIAIQIRASLAKTRSRTLTNSPVRLSWLLALGIVAGSSVSECADAQELQGSKGEPLTDSSARVMNLDQLTALLDSFPTHGSTKLPEDAVIVPYSMDQFIEGVSAKGLRSAPSDKLLVPYQIYTRLMRASQPQIGKLPSPPSAAAWSGLQYRASLGQPDQVIVRGQATIQVFSAQPTTVPIDFHGGILESLTVNGTPGRLIVQEQATGALGLWLDGQSKNRVEFQLHYKVSRSAGWSTIQGRLPIAPATLVELEVVQPESELILTSGTHLQTIDVQSANQAVQTTLVGDGSFKWQWRQKIAASIVDPSLKLNSQTTFDVQESGTRLTWRGQFQFRNGSREGYLLSLPGDYQVERVTGPNIRSWSLQADGAQQQVRIELLASAAGSDTITLQASRRAANGEVNALPANQATTSVPQVTVPEAIEHQGLLIVRRSVLVDLRASNLSGLDRSDLPANTDLSVEEDVSPIPLVAYQAFRYSQAPYRMELTATASKSRIEVETRSLLRLSQLETTLESQLIVTANHRSLHHLRITAPTNWKIDRPGIAVDFEWSTVASDSRQQIDLYFATGFSGALPIVLRGAYSAASLDMSNDNAAGTLELPSIRVEDADRERGELVVISDPAFDVSAESLQNCELSVISAANNWLAPELRPLARLLINSVSDQSSPKSLSGQLRLTRRAPQATAFTMTNVKLTDRTIEETVYVEWTIRSAGLRALQLVLPIRLTNATVRGPLIRNQNWIPVDANSVRLQIELQEEVMGQYCLIIESDRLLSAGEQTVPIPKLETGQTENRFVLLENSGRDELVVGRREGLTTLERGQAKFRFLSSLLGGKVTEAFVAADNVAVPLLTFTTKDRLAIETVGARIGIAQTHMIVDESGTYRGMQEYRVENRTEQFLEIELPPGSTLWSVLVAGESVKPITASTSNRVRIPLVKTAAGDLDYPVNLKYGGTLARPGGMATTRFPFLKTVNINVELSQVRLYLPASMQWMNFGGTLRRVQSQDELTADWIAFRTRQLAGLTQLLKSSSEVDYSGVRAANNLKSLAVEVEDFRRLSNNFDNQKLRDELAANDRAWFDAQQQLQLPDQTQAQTSATTNNRFLLNQRLDNQSIQRSLNIANDTKSQFDIPSEPQLGQSEGKDFNPEWLAKNALAVKGSLEADKPSDMKPQSRLGRVQAAPQDADQVAELLAAASKGESKRDEGRQREMIQADDTAGSKVQRYQRRLQEQSQAPDRSRGSQAGFGGGMAPQTTPPGLSPGQAFGMNGPMGGAAFDGQLNAGGAAILGDLAAGDGAGKKANAGTLPSGAPAAAPPAGYLVSLDTELPIRGDEYLFTTPGGGLEITAQSLSNDSRERWIKGGTALVITLCALAGYFFGRKTKAVGPR